MTPSDKHFRTGICSWLRLSDEIEMIRLNANVLCEFVRDLTKYEINAAQLDKAGQVTDADATVLEPILKLCDYAVEFFDLPATGARKTRVVEAIKAHMTYDELRLQLTTLRQTMEDELRERLVLFMPSSGAVHFFAGAELLGKPVAEKFPRLVADIDEAGKCFATARYTAAVFHLMRVMEVGVQQLGKHLNVDLTEQKVWQVILDQVNAAIRQLNQKSQKTKKLAAIAAHLYNVKLAWRNEVMHPKATYTEEEAEQIITATKLFMGDFLTVLPKPKKTT